MARILPGKLIFRDKCRTGDDPSAQNLEVELRERVEAVVGQRVVAVEEIAGAGGYTPALRRVAALADGSTVFVKAAVTDTTAAWIATEHAAYRALTGAPYLASYLGGDEQVLVLEDLRSAWWPTPWRPGDIELALALLDEVAATPVPSWVPAAQEMDVNLHHGWSTVADDPRPFLSLELCDERWLAHAMPALASAAERAPIEGDALLHFDFRSDNICIRDGRALLVDWNLLCRGNPMLDQAFFAESLTVEGGPPPWDLLPAAPPGIVSVLAGFFAARAPGPPLPRSPRVRSMQLAQLRICLPWAARALGLPPPT
ncbi:MAG TPA: hypothetical protein VMY34_04830 [Acidimicrobiales bacterium]|nr:hypothetical protein [Acidimicrobiales bacterium]